MDMETVTATLCASAGIRPAAEPFRVEFVPLEPKNHYGFTSEAERTAVEAKAIKIAGMFYDRLGSHFLETFVKELIERFMATKGADPEVKEALRKALKRAAF